MKIKLLPILLSALLIISICGCRNVFAPDAGTTEKDTATETPLDNETTTPENEETTMSPETETTVPDDTDTTVLDDTDTTIPDVPSVDLSQEVQSVEVFDNDGERITLSVGMRWKDLEEIVPVTLEFYHLTFVKNTDNHVVLMEMGNQIEHIWLFPDIPVPTDDDFYKLEPGMSLLEVISLIGAPQYPAASSIHAGAFVSDSGTMYLAEFRNFNGPTRLKITLLAIYGKGKIEKMIFQ